MAPFGRAVPALAVAVFLAGPAQAEPSPMLPDIFNVVGVSGDDVLNIRAEPSASATIIGRLAPDATGIEAVAAQGGWLQVNTGERSGWVSGRYLMAQPGIWPKGGLPAGLACFGTEPFWGLSQQGGSVALSSIGNDSQSWPVEAVLATGAPQDRRRVLLAGALTAVVIPAACNDGMSDRAYGLEAVLVLGRGAGAQMLDGCCVLSGR